MSDVRLSISCPNCGYHDVFYCDLGDETDVDGTYGNFRVWCSACGRMTADMNTLEDAIAAFNGNDDTVFYREGCSNAE